MLWGLLAAVSVALLIVWPPAGLWSRRPRVPKPASPPTQAAWVTRQALRYMGWSPRKTRGLQVGAALMVGALWFGVTDNVLAGLLFTLIGWQLPLLWAEIRGSGFLGRQMRQIAQFIATVADGVNVGHSVALAVDTAARRLTDPPLGTLSDALVRRVNSGMPLDEALDLMGQAISWRWWDLFVDFVGLAQNAGGSGKVFEALAWRLQEQDRIQAEFRILISIYLILIVIFLSLIILGALGERLLNPTGWTTTTHYLSWTVLIASGLAVYCFGGVRRYARMMVQLES